MKKYFAFLMMAAVMAACTSEEQPKIVEEPEVQMYTMSITATKGEDSGDDETTRGLELVGKTLNTFWSTTENVYVQKGSTWATGSLQPQEDGSSSTLKGTLTIAGGISAGDDLFLQFPRSGERDYSGQVGTLADIASKYDYATATVKVASISATGEINPVAATTTFDNQQAIVKFTLKNKDTDAAISAAQLIVSDGTNSYTVTPASASSEIYVAIPGFSNKTITLEASIAGKLFTYSRNPVTFTDGQYYEITVKMSAVPGSLAGKFTINESGDQVHFSQGNLRATTTDHGDNWAWSFAELQYDYIGNNNVANTSISGSMRVGTNGTVDLFGWNGYSSVNDHYGISNSATDADYGNTAGETLKHDWGLNPITNGGNTADIWRTLTKDEWLYVFNTRSTTSGVRFATATVNGINGVILLPDDWSTTYYTLSSTNTLDEVIDNSISLNDWNNYLEAHGAVFLPSAGLRVPQYDVSTPYPAETYWSSTSNESDSAQAYCIFVTYYGGGNDVRAANLPRKYRCSVRLVRDAK